MSRKRFLIQKTSCYRNKCHYIRKVEKYSIQTTKSDSEISKRNIGIAQISEDTKRCTRSFKEFEKQKTSYSDKIANEMIKYDGSELEKALTSLFQRIVLNE